MGSAKTSGGSFTAPNRAPAAKVLTSAFANARVAQSLINALGGYAVEAAVVSTSVSPSNAQFANLAIGDYFIHIPASPGNVQAAVVVAAGVAPITPIVGDLYIDLTPVALDSNNPLAGNTTGDGGIES
jgi:hypothetical protein